MTKHLHWLRTFLCLCSLSSTAKTLHPYVNASANFQVSHYQINIAVDPAIRYIKANVTATIQMTESDTSIIWDFTNQLKVDSVLYEHKKIHFSQFSNNTLALYFKKEFKKASYHVITIYYKGIPPIAKNADNSFDYSFITNKHKGVPILFVVNEPFGASAWMPCRNGLDDKADSIDFVITHPKKYTASANGRLVDRIENNETASTHFAHHYPISAYLMAFAVSNYKIFINHFMIGDTQQAYVFCIYPENEKAFRLIEDSLVNSFKLCYQLFGAYPFVGEPYIQTQMSGGGGMEHQGNSFIDGPDVVLQNHELIHQWFGNKVGCKSWSQIWLKEGAAEWYANFLYPYYNGHLSQLKKNLKNGLQLITSKPNGQLWVKDSTSIDRLFDDRLTYIKASFIYRMLQYELGDSLFFKGIRLYLNKYQFNYAGTEDIQACMEIVSGKDLSKFFKQWIYGEGHPSFDLQWHQITTDGKLKIHLTQKTSHPSVPSFTMLVPILLKGAQNEKLISIQSDLKDIEIAAPGFEVQSVIIDPDQWLITGKNNITKKKTNTISTN
jgi:aminopeptidase N